MTKSVILFLVEIVGVEPVFFRVLQSIVYA